VQGDGTLIDQEVVRFDADFLNSAVARHLQFWKGDLPPEKVAPDEEWKCGHCNFRSKCKPKPFHNLEADRLRNVPWQH
jgi:exonuclease V